MDKKIIWNILETDFWILTTFVFSVISLLFFFAILFSKYIEREIGREDFRLMTTSLFISSVLMIPLYIEYKKTKF